MQPFPSLTNVAANLRDVSVLLPSGTVRFADAPLLRSSTLAALPETSLDLITAKAGPGVYIDLRTARELNRDGDISGLVARGWEWDHRPIDDRGTGEQVAGLDHGLSQHLAAARRVVTVFGRQRPTLVACSLGKDRTGIVIALLLNALGVERSQIVADYVLSNVCLAAQRHLLPARWADDRAAIRSVTPSECLSALTTAEKLGAQRELRDLAAADPCL